MSWYCLLSVRFPFENATQICVFLISDDHFSTAFSFVGTIFDILV